GPEEDREKARRLLTLAFDDGRISSVEYQRDPDGRIVSSVRRMGIMSEERTTYSYDGHGNVTEQIDEVHGVNLGLDESGAIITRQEAPISNHHRFDYSYDARGNWTEKVGWVKIGEDFTRFDIERRVFTYYGGGRGAATEINKKKITNKFFKIKPPTSTTKSPFVLLLFQC